MTNPLLERLKKSGSIKSDTLSASKLFKDKDTTVTDVPALNIALSGSPTGGLTSGLLFIAGESKTYKTCMSLKLVAAYLEQHKDAVCLFYDSEFGTTDEYMKNQNVDTERVIHIPIMDVEQLKFDLMKRLTDISNGDKVIIFIDSVGNLASKKEVDDALDEKAVADMSRAKQMKSLFRMITPHLTIKNIPCVAINHTYKEIGLYPKTIMSGGCLTKGHKIVTDKGIQNIENILPGDLVRGYDGNFHEVEFVWNSETLADPYPTLYEVELDNGNKIVCSYKHKFRTVDGNWVNVENYNNEELFMLQEQNITMDNMKIKSIKKLDTKDEVFDLTVKDVNSYVDSNGICHHNTGGMYSANTVWIISKSQEKDGTELEGFTFTLNIEKSRFIKEKSKIPLKVLFDSGIDKNSGLLDLALESGHIVKPSNGWYSLKDTEEKVREKDTGPLLEKLLLDESFVNWIIEKYRL